MTQLQHILVVLSRQGFDNLGRMPQPGRLDQQSVRPGLMDQLIEANLHWQASHTAHAAARNFPHKGTFCFQHGAINSHLTEFIHQNRPYLAVRFFLQQVQYGSGFTHPQKTEYQIGGNW